MTDRYIKTVEGGEETNPDETDAIEIDDGVNSNWVKISNILQKLTSGTFTSGRMATGRLGSGTASSTNYLRGDSAWGTPKLDDLATPDDNTDLNASTSNHGLILKATAPSSGIRNVVAIDNAETVYKNTALLDNTAPADLAASASSGTSLIAARRDHVHSNNTVTPIDGWLPISATWTRTGNHTFTVSGDVTTSYRKGTKVRYKDGGSYEYGVIASAAYSAPNTTITLITNSDYAMAAATITDKYISYIENPEGWVDWFNWTPTLTGFSADPTSTVYRWRAYGQTCKCFIRQGATGTSNATTFTISAPVTAATITNMQWGVLASVTDNSVFLTTPGAVRILSAGTVFDVFKDSSLAAFTNSGTKRVYSANIEYQF